MFDVLTYVSFLKQPISRTQRVAQSKKKILKGLDENQIEFLDFVLSKYEEKLPKLLNLKYHSIADAEQVLGNVDEIRSVFFSFQKLLYSNTE
ncbi:MAG: hypothetical protein O2871_02810 [bacterium]|nr:hypothetical protein [bacterium]